jgi:hypothetical protein
MSPRKALTPKAAPIGKEPSGAIDYLVMGHVAADWLAGLKRPVLGGTATYAAATARNLGARVGVHTSAAYESGL